MSEDETRNFSANDKLDLILQQVGLINERIVTLDQRVVALEAKSSDTRPIWERALAELLEIKERLIALEKRQPGFEEKMELELKEIRKEIRQFRRQVEIQSGYYLSLTADVRDVEDRVTAIENQQQRPLA